MDQTDSTTPMTTIRTDSACVSAATDSAANRPPFCPEISDSNTNSTSNNKNSIAAAAAAAAAVTNSNRTGGTRRRTAQPCYSRWPNKTKNSSSNRNRTKTRRKRADNGIFSILPIHSTGSVALVLVPVAVALVATASWFSSGTCAFESAANVATLHRPFAPAPAPALALALAATVANYHPPRDTNSNIFLRSKSNINANANANCLYDSGVGRFGFGSDFGSRNGSRNRERSMLMSLPTSMSMRSFGSGSSTTNTNTRGYCPRCKRPDVVCICHALPDEKIDCGTRILILQHPREAKKRKRTSTVPLIGLSIQNVAICVGTRFEHGSHPLLDQAVAMAAENENNNDNNNKDENESDQTNHGGGSIGHALLLYPSDRAMPLQTYLEQTEHGNENSSGSFSCSCSNNILVVLDGTWAQTQSMVQNSHPLLGNLPSVMFDDETNSLFDSLRQEPAPHCTSTLEAIARAIRLLGSGNCNDNGNGNDNGNNAAGRAADALEQSLRAMVAGQLHFALDKDSARPRYCRKDGSDESETQTQTQTQTQALPNRSGSVKGTKRARKLVSRRRSAELRLAPTKTKEEIELDRIRFVYIAHMG